MMKKDFQRTAARFITTLQEAYSAIIPYFLLISFFTLFISLLQYFKIHLSFIDPEYLSALLDALALFSSIVIVISIAHFFAKRFQISTIISATLAIACYVTAIFIEDPLNLFLGGENYGFAIQTLFIPIVSTLFLHLFYPRFSLGLPMEDENIHIYRLFDYIFAFALAYFATVITYFSIDYVMDRVIEFVLANFSLSFLPDIVILALRDLLVQLFWFIGIHGEHTVNAFFGKEFLSVELFPNLTAAEFNRLFVSIGGAGAGMALLIALFALTKDRLLRTITNISAPFVVFNINTLLIYAVVVFNRFLFIPFVFIPLINIFLAYIFIKIFNIEFTSYYIVWTTPVFIDGYIKSGGNFLVLFIQALLLTIDTYLYGIYLQRFFTSQSSESNVAILSHNLNIPELIQPDQNIEPFIARREIISSNARLYRFINEVNAQNLFLYYQPKIDIEHGRCDHFEALIRYKKGDKIVGPYFLDIFEKARLAAAIDIWVAKEAKRALIQWHQKDFYPTLNINLHPDTLSNTSAIKKIVDILQGEKVNFEIIERSFLQGKEAFKNLSLLQKHGFGISIDDYGTGYTNMETILNYKIDEIKLDRNLILRAHERKGFLVCSSIVDMARGLGIRSVAEGVETPEQFELARKMRVSYVQGFLFSPAIPFERTIVFARSFRLQNYLTPRSQA